MTDFHPIPSAADAANAGGAHEVAEPFTQDATRSGSPSYLGGDDGTRSILDRVVAIVGETLGGHRVAAILPEIDEMTCFERDLRCDAIDMVCITQAVEEQLHVDLPMDVENCRTVGDLAALVERVTGGTE